jgi:hypothetical protein
MSMSLVRERPKGVGVDDMRNVYGGWVAKMNMRRFVTQ